MYVLIDKMNLKLRGVFTKHNDVTITDDMVVTPKEIFIDMNSSNAMLKTYNEKIPENWKYHDYYFNKETGKFQRTRFSNGIMIFINEE